MASSHHDRTPLVTLHSNITSLRWSRHVILGHTSNNFLSLLASSSSFCIMIRNLRLLTYSRANKPQHLPIVVKATAQHAHQKGFVDLIWFDCLQRTSCSATDKSIASIQPQINGSVPNQVLQSLLWLHMRRTNRIQMEYADHAKCSLCAHGKM